MSLISIIVPMYNEKEIASYSMEKLIEIGNGLDEEYEIVVINDGSNDETDAIIESFAAENEKIKLISFSRNFGHQMAISAGLDFASGDAVIIIDGDLQDPPELIPDMIDKWKEGWHVVYGKRRSRKGESWFKLITARLYYKILSKLIDIEIPENVGDFRLMDKMVVEEFRNLHERHRYVRGMVTWLGYRQTEILYDRVERIAGDTKYPFKKMIKFALDGIFSFSIVPLKVASYVGLLSTLIAIVYSIYLIIHRLLGYGAPGFASIIISILFFGGIQLFSIGILGQYVGRIYEEVKKRPNYIVEKSINFRSTDKK